MNRRLNSQFVVWSSPGAGRRGCAQEQAPIDRVQPDYFDKSFFVGQNYLDTSDDPEFYLQGTLVDVGYGAGQDGLFTSTYAQPVSRVKWQSRGHPHRPPLVRAHRRLRRQGPRQARPKNGIVVAAYSMPSTSTSSATTTQTGEQSNVIEENDQDRPGTSGSTCASTGRRTCRPTTTTTTRSR